LIVRRASGDSPGLLDTGVDLLAHASNPLGDRAVVQGGNGRPEAVPRLECIAYEEAPRLVERERVDPHGVTVADDYGDGEADGVPGSESQHQPRDPHGRQTQCSAEHGDDHDERVEEAPPVHAEDSSR
jgi:hypothetical protein